MFPWGNPDLAIPGEVLFMLYVLYKTVSSFILFPGLGVLLCLILAYRLMVLRPYRKRTGFLLLLLGFLLYGASTALGPAILLRPLERPYYETQLPPPGPSTGVMVLGGGYWVGPEGKTMLGPFTVTRLVRGMEAARALDGWILCSGTAVLSSGDTKSVQPLGNVMAHFARQWGWKGDILAENGSRTTWENIRLAQPLLRAKDAERVILVTDAFHMNRSLAMARRTFSIPVYPFPSTFLGGTEEWTFQSFLPTMGELMKSWYGLHEWLGIVAYGFYEKVGNILP